MQGNSKNKIQESLVLQTSSSLETRGEKNLILECKQIVLGKDPGLLHLECKICF